jgi:hypothetical protein
MSQRVPSGHFRAAGYGNRFTGQGHRGSEAGIATISSRGRLFESHAHQGIITATTLIPPGHRWCAHARLDQQVA